MNERHRRNIYLLGDYCSTLLGVMVFNAVRYLVVFRIETQFDSVWTFLRADGVVLTMILFPPLMLLIYAFSGLYVSVSSRSRIVDILKMSLDIVVGSVVFFFAVLLDDLEPGKLENYRLLIVLIITMLVCVIPVRFIITTRFVRHRGNAANKVAYMVTDRPVTDQSILDRISRTAREHGFTLAGTVMVDALSEHAASSLDAGRLGYILSPEISEQSVIDALGQLYGECIPLFFIPGEKTLLLERVRYNDVVAEPMIDIAGSQLSDGIVALKRGGDIFASSLGLILSMPVIAVLAALIKIEDGGPVFYSQERVGYLGRKFRLHKMRSMSVDAEADGPQLSSAHDSRVTRIGRVMRQYRLDELPNLWNVLKGDMSLVGPRPEREYYLRQIAAIAPQSVLLRQVRPGVTSWGMVKYGYAETVEGMVDRLKYDILYLQNMSLSIDLRILYQTVFTVMRGEGK